MSALTRQPLLTAAREAYTLSKGPDKEGHVIAVIYTDHLAVKNPSQSVIRDGVNVGPRAPAVVIPLAGPGLTNPAVQRRYLWKDLVPGEGWFVSANSERRRGWKRCRDSGAEVHRTACPFFKLHERERGCNRPPRGNRHHHLGGQLGGPHAWGAFAGYGQRGMHLHPCVVDGQKHHRTESSACA